MRYAARLVGNKLHDVFTQSRASHTLQDTFGRQHTYLRISVSERCNLRCVYCMPEEGVTLTPSPSLLTNKVVIYLSTLFAKAGVNKIRLTGGEPTVNKSIVSLVSELKSIPGINDVSMTTNAVTLSRQLPALLKAGLDNVNISLDTLVPQKFAFITRRTPQTLKKVREGLEAALNSDIPSVKINVVVMQGFNEDELCDFADLTKDSRLSVRFLEYMPFNGNKWSNLKFIPYQEQKRVLEERFGPLLSVTDTPDSTSNNFRISNHVGSVGFISSMSRNFCGGCNRLRLTHDGNLKMCLFGKDEVSLRDLIRTDHTEEDLLSVIGGAVKRKKKSHGGEEEIIKQMKRPMIFIGG